MTKMKLRRELRAVVDEKNYLEESLVEEIECHKTTKRELSKARFDESLLRQAEEEKERLKEELEDARLSAAWYRKEMLCLREELEELQKNTNKTGF